MRTGVQEKSAENPQARRERNGAPICALLPQLRSLKNLFQEIRTAFEKREPCVRTACGLIALQQFPFSRYIRQISGRDSLQGA
jgi:hypothetical protein